jgi:UDP-N-acetylglucosamine diphosphorylase / glucose-1-phosphate thymidylyltransferase / UDP-N-acetylgalactosamine diphosphorylase / glucosamine-1-phosphate N-acetyltransferase / galactosamine-1-phosphate N-acetyltransferase
MNIVVFEDGLHDNFYPLSLTKPLWELRSGLYSFRERLELMTKNISGTKTDIYYFTREYLAQYYREKYPELRINDYEVFKQRRDILFLNAVWYPSGHEFSLENNRAVLQGPVPVCARIGASRVCVPGGPIHLMILKMKLAEQGLNGEGGVSPGRYANYIWELVDWNGDTIKSDYILSGLKGPAHAGKDVTILGEIGLLYVEENVEIEPFVVFDVTRGPIVIGSGTKINAFTRIEGPCAIGRNCIILGGKVRSGTSIGDFCRIGGEIEQSIFFGYSNKYHDGFIGHSYIGEWVNMGALTTNSDLKNNYSNVKVYTPDSRKKTGLKKIGCFMGDFVKTGIGTLINTGASIGPGAMIVHDGKLAPFHIPPFSRYIDSSVSRLSSLGDFIDLCKSVALRRNVDLPDSFITLITTLFDITLPDKK